MHQRHLLTTAAITTHTHKCSHLFVGDRSAYTHTHTEQQEKTPAHITKKTSNTSWSSNVTSKNIVVQIAACMVECSPRCSAHHSKATQVAVCPDRRCQKFRDVQGVRRGNPNNAQVQHSYIHAYFKRVRNISNVNPSAARRSQPHGPRSPPRSAPRRRRQASRRPPMRSP